MTIGLLHPGEMGAAIGGALQKQGESVLWASHGRSAATARRAEQAGLQDVGDVSALGERCHVLLSVCPPHAAVDVARSAAGFAGIYVDANAVSSATARAIGGIVDRFVDGGIVGPPPREPGTTRLYLAGAEAAQVAALFVGSPVDARVVPGEPGAASTLKMAYAGWTKGSSALLLAVRALARAEGVEEALVAEWALSLPSLTRRSEAAAASAVAKGSRWVGEMEEIADSFTAAGLPAGFHRAAGELYARASQVPAEEAGLEQVLEAIRVAGHPPSGDGGIRVSPSSSGTTNAASST